MADEGIKIEEGKWYIFQIEKQTEITGTGWHFVLKGPDNRRYLLPAERYKSYRLEPGNKVNCRVDKINCKGEVFIEPINPYYTEDRKYLFQIVEFRELHGSRIRDGRVMVVKTVSGELIPVPVPFGLTMPDPGNMVELLVLRISKGRLHLTIGNEKGRLAHLDSGAEYEFVVDGMETDIDGEEYFVILDQTGVAHAIKRSYYEYYGLRVGSKFKGRVVKYREDGSRMIEPENPFYRTGQTVTIDIIKNERNEADGSYYVAGKDKYGMTHELRLSKKVEGERISCKVVMIRKGKPLLEKV